MILSVTWANHYSALKNLAHGKTYNEFSLVGIDGFFLRFLLRSKKTRSSADLVLPSILSSVSLRVILVGSSKNNQPDILREFKTHYPRIQVVKQMKGYDQLSSERLAEEILREMPEMVVIGLGPVKQEEFAIEIIKSLEGTYPKDLLLLTCGGWLDQITVQNYYPRFAYKFRLNWLVRLLKEPRRLWKRYTIYAFIAVRRTKELRNYFYSLPGYRNVENIQSEIVMQIMEFLQVDNKNGS